MEVKTAFVLSRTLDRKIGGGQAPSSFVGVDGCGKLSSGLGFKASDAVLVTAGNDVALYSSGSSKRKVMSWPLGSFNGHLDSPCVLDSVSEKCFASVFTAGEIGGHLLISWHAKPDPTFHISSAICSSDQSRRLPFRPAALFPLVSPGQNLISPKTNHTEGSEKEHNSLGGVLVLYENGALEAFSSDLKTLSEPIFPSKDKWQAIEAYATNLSESSTSSSSTRSWKLAVAFSERVLLSSSVEVKERNFVEKRTLRVFSVEDGGNGRKDQARTAKVRVIGSFPLERGNETEGQSRKEGEKQVKACKQQVVGISLDDSLTVSVLWSDGVWNVHGRQPTSQHWSEVTISQTLKNFIFSCPVQQHNTSDTVQRKKSKKRKGEESHGSAEEGRDGSIDSEMKIASDTNVTNAKRSFDARLVAVPGTSYVAIVGQKPLAPTDGLVPKAKNAPCLIILDTRFGCAHFSGSLSLQSHDSKQLDSMGNGICDRFGALVDFKWVGGGGGEGRGRLMIAMESVVLGMSFSLPDVSLAGVFGALRMHVPKKTESKEEKEKEQGSLGGWVGMRNSLVDVADEVFSETWEATSSVIATGKLQGRELEEGNAENDGSIVLRIGADIEGQQVMEDALLKEKNFMKRLKEGMDEIELLRLFIGLLETKAYAETFSGLPHQAEGKSDDEGQILEAIDNQDTNSWDDKRWCYRKLEILLKKVPYISAQVEHHVIWRCMENKLWETLWVMIACKRASVASYPPLISDLISDSQMALLQICLLHVKDLSPTDLAMAVRFFASSSSIARTAMAELVLSRRQAVQSQIDAIKAQAVMMIHSRESLCARAKALSLEALSIDRFSPREQCFHALVGVERDASVISSLFDHLRLDELNTLFSYLTKCVEIYGSMGLFDIKRLSNSKGGGFCHLPPLSRVLMWTGCFLDSHLTSVMFNPRLGEAAQRLHLSVTGQIEDISALSCLMGVANHLKYGLCIPPIDDSATGRGGYTIEILDLT